MRCSLHVSKIIEHHRVKDHNILTAQARCPPSRVRKCSESRPKAGLHRTCFSWCLNSRTRPRCKSENSLNAQSRYHVTSALQHLGVVNEIPTTETMFLASAASKLKISSLKILSSNRLDWRVVQCKQLLLVQTQSIMILALLYCKLFNLVCTMSLLLQKFQLQPYNIHWSTTWVKICSWVVARFACGFHRSMAERVYPDRHWRVWLLSHLP